MASSLFQFLLLKVEVLTFYLSFCYWYIEHNYRFTGSLKEIQREVLCTLHHPPRRHCPARLQHNVSLGHRLQRNPQIFLRFCSYTRIRLCACAHVRV